MNQSIPVIDVSRISGEDQQIHKGSKNVSFSAKNESIDEDKSNSSEKPNAENWSNLLQTVM